MDKIFVINELDNEFKKFYVETKKKYTTIRDVKTNYYNR